MRKLDTSDPDFRRWADQNSLSANTRNLTVYRAELRERRAAASRRLDNIRHALEPYVAAKQAELRQHVLDLITDMRHYCEANGVNYHAAEETSYQHYLEERRSFVPKKGTTK